VIIFRYLSKEVFVTFISLTLILLLIFMSNQVVIYLNRAASGIIPGMLVMKLMLLELPNLLSLLLPLGFYVALLLAYGRLYADSEMTVLQACGYGPGKLLQHSMLMGLVVALFTAVMMSLSPTIAYKRAKLLQTTGIKTLIQTIVPGRFRALPNGNEIFYVASMNREHTVAKDLFLARLVQENGVSQWDVLWANRAFLQDVKNVLVLEKGAKYQGVPGRKDYQVANFSRMEVLLPKPQFTLKNDIRTEKFHNLLPWNNPDREKAAELQWRVSIPLMVFILTLVAVPLSRINPRSGKYAKILPAIILYIVYANFMFVSRNWIVIGKIPIWMGLWWLHISVTLIGAWLFWHNTRRLA
jgi:lipopolysaccharide export system permease protein